MYPPILALSYLQEQGFVVEMDGDGDFDEAVPFAVPFVNPS